MIGSLQQVRGELNQYMLPGLFRDYRVDEKE
jgi:hypothetical protein